MRVVTGVLATILAIIVGAGSALAEQSVDERMSRAVLFPEPTEMGPQVAFWRAIFAEYSKYQVVLHDAVHIDKVYKVLDFRHYLDEGVGESEVERLMRFDTDLELERI